MSTFAFSVSCDSEVTSLARVFDVFAVQGYKPSQFHAQRQLDDYILDVECDGLDATTAERIKNKLVSLVTVSTVLISPKVLCR